MSTEAPTPPEDPKDVSGDADLTPTEPDETEEPKAGVTKGRMYLWAGAGLVAIYFIVTGIIGLVKGDVPTDPATLGATTQTISQHV